MNRSERRRRQKQAGKTAGGGSAQNALQRAVELHGQGRVAEAEKLYKQVLSRDPKQPVALHLLGVCAYQSGRNARAVELISKAVAVQPNYAEAHGNLGNVFNAMGYFVDAAASYRAALKLQPGFADLHNNLGCMLAALGKLDDAVASCRQAVALQPSFAEAHNNLANVLADLGQVGEAFAHYRRAAALDPDNETYWAAMADPVEVITFSSADDGLCQDLARLLDHPAVRPARVVAAVLSALRHQPDFSAALEAADGELDGANALARLSRVPLLLKLLSLTPINDLQVERLLTRVRRELLSVALADGAHEDALPFAAALALQCFANEYVYGETEQEREDVDVLAARIAERIEAGGDPPSMQLAALGAYRPLYTFAWSMQLRDRAAREIVALVTRQIDEPLQERELRAAIPALTNIADTVSKSVREQYEENPYPRWIKTGLAARGKPIAEVLEDFDLGDYVSPQAPDILVAGCGTGQQALGAATRFAGAKVLAVDLSLSSLAYAKRMTEALGVTNIDYAQADILELGGLKRRFDLIGCTGVLHHLQDPMAGWRVLVDLLRSGGVMKVALYSEAARQGVVQARAMIQEKGYVATPEDMRRCRADIAAMAEAGDPLMADLCAFRDFYSLSECRDLIFHVQEHRFTALQIEVALKELGLQFLGFEMRGGDALKAFRETYPKPGDRTDLVKWHAFEQDHPQTFRGMYQFWCRKP